MDSGRSEETSSEGQELWRAVKEQARLAVISGGIACALTSLVALAAPGPLAAAGAEALRMTLGLTAVVPPAILIVGRLLTRRLRRDA